MKSRNLVSVSAAAVLLAVFIMGSLSILGRKARNVYVNVNTNLARLPQKGASFKQSAPEFRVGAFSDKLQTQMLAPGMGMPGGMRAPGAATVPFERSWVYAQTRTIAPTETNVAVTLNIIYKPEGVERLDRIWVAQYEADFKGDYTIVNESKKPVLISLKFPFPPTAGTLSKVSMQVDGHEPAVAQYTKDGITWSTKFLPKEKKKATITYNAKGVQDFRYALDHTIRLRTFAFHMLVKGVDKLEFPKDCMLPTAKKKVTRGWDAEWRRDNLITQSDIGVIIPVKPSLYEEFRKLLDLARVSPLLIVLFLACVYAAAVNSGVRTAPQHYPLLGIGFYFFYPIMLYLAVHLPFQTALLVATVVVGFVVLQYVKKLVSLPFAALTGPLFLVLFYVAPSEAMLTDKYRALILVGALFLLVAYFMAVVRPQQLLAQETDASALEPGEEPAEPVEEGESSPQPEPEVVPVSQPVAALTSEPEHVPPPPSRYCAYCGEAIDRSYRFCPACGKDARVFLSCPSCGVDLVRKDTVDFGYCPSCGGHIQDASSEPTG